MVRDRVTAFGLALIALIAVGLAGLYALDVLELPTAVRSGFALVAAVLGLFFYRLTHGGDSLDERPGLSGPNTARIVVSLGAVAVLATALTGERLLPVVLSLGLGYLLVSAQLAREEPPVVSTLVALSVLVATPAATKYLTTGFFFAGTDTFAHVEALRSLLGTQYTTAIPHGYDLFPVFHLVVGAVSLFVDLSPCCAVGLS
jgi:hypothetical protein